MQTNTIRDTLWGRSAGPMLRRVIGAVELSSRPIAAADRRSGTGLGCGRGRARKWEHGVYPRGDRQRELAIRRGVNIVMYALCVEYKADQVHIPFILKRRPWRVR